MPIDESAAAPRSGNPVQPHVMTVLGPVAAETLGLTLPHEHLIADFTPAVGSRQAAEFARSLESADAKRCYEAPLSMAMLSAVEFGAPNRDNDRLDDEVLATAEIAAFREAGGSAIVELTSADLGRNPQALRRLAEATGVTIVMGAGFGRPAATGNADESNAQDAGELAERIVSEITDGVDGVRAGVIGRIPALDPAMPAERALLEAVAAASHQTGAPIAIARAAETDATLRMLAALADGGADLRQVALCHCSELATHPDDLERLLAPGVTVMFDGLGRLPTVASTWDDGDVAQAVAELARRGHAEQIMLSSGVRAKLRLLAYGGGGYAFIPQQYLPFLRMMTRADDALIDTLTVRNPRHFLTIAAGGAL